MVKLAKGLSWKPLSMKSRVLSHNLDLDGLIGVEELTDYRLDKKNKTVVIGVPKSFPKVQSDKSKIKSAVKFKKDKSKKREKINKLKVTKLNGETEQQKSNKCTPKPVTQQITPTVKESTDHQSKKDTPTTKDDYINKRKRRKINLIKIKMEKRKQRKLLKQQQENEYDGKVIENVSEEAMEEDSTEEPTVAPFVPSSKPSKKKQRNKFKIVEEAIVNSEEKKEESDEEKLEPHSKKYKQKKKNKKKKSYLSLNKDQTVPESSSSEEIFVEMAEWAKFNIPESVLRALQEKGFKTPTKIQSLVLPSALLARKDIVGAAETGSGKTLAFGIPILSGIVSRLENPQQEEDEDSGLEEEEEDVLEDSHNVTEFVKKKRGKLYALILAPTRELAIQVQNHLIEAGKYTPVKIACVVGGMSTEKQLRILNSSPHILVATPGRLWEFIQLGHFHLTELYKINYLVIDETDRMIESGHFPELKNILDRVTMTETSQPRQTFVFSATLTHSLKNSLAAKKTGKNKKSSKSDPSMKRLQDLLKIKSPKIVDITEKVGLTKTLTESKIFCKHDEKDSYLYYFILQHPGRTLVFCNSISSVKRMTLLLTMLKCSPLPLHASMNQRQRLKNLDKFRSDENSILLATDVAARGLDIPGIEHVIHYHVPRTSDIYIHRSGRTARANKEGLTVVLVESDEIPLYIKMFNSLDKKADLPEFPIDENFMSLVNKRLELAKSIEHLEGRIKKNRPDNWLEKAAKDMDIIIDDPNLIQPKENSRENALLTKALNAKKKDLQALLSKAIQNYQLGGITVTQSALNAVKLAVADDKEEKRNALKKRNKHRRKFKKKKPKNKSTPATES